MSSSDVETVLIVDDNTDLIEIYRQWLKKPFNVLTAQNGKDAIDLLENVDILLLNRQVPDHEGVIEELRDRDTQIVILTGVDPDFKVIEMPIDDYVLKPVKADELNEIVEKTLRRRNYNEKVQDYLSLLSKKNALDSNKSLVELQGNQDYKALIDKLSELREEIPDTLDLDEKDLIYSFDPFSLRPLCS